MRPSEVTAPAVDWSRLQVALLWVYRGRVAPPLRGFQDPVPTMTAWLVLKGTAAVGSGRAELLARPGEWLFPRPVSRRQFFSPDAEILSVRFRLEWPDGRQLFDDGPGVIIASSACPELLRRARGLERIAAGLRGRPYTDASLALRPIDFPQFLRLERAVHRWAETVYDALLRRGLRPVLPPHGDPRARTLQRELETWPLDRPFRAADLERKTFLSRRQVEKLAVTALGGDPKELIERRRLAHALLALRAGTPVKRVAAEIGFAHSSTFCAWFRKKTGRAPREVAGSLI